MILEYKYIPGIHDLTPSGIDYYSVIGRRKRPECVLHLRHQGIEHDRPNPPAGCHSARYYSIRPTTPATRAMASDRICLLWIFRPPGKARTRANTIQRLLCGSYGHGREGLRLVVKVHRLHCCVLWRVRCTPSEHDNAPRREANKGEERGAGTVNINPAEQGDGHPCGHWELSLIVSLSLGRMAYNLKKPQDSRWTSYSAGNGSGPFVCPWCRRCARMRSLSWPFRCI